MAVATKKKARRKASGSAGRKKPSHGNDATVIRGYRAIAKRYEVSTKTVQNWIAAGMPCHGPARSRTFHAQETDPWVSSYRQTVDPDNPDIELRRRKMAAEAEIKEIERDERRIEAEAKRGNILRRDEHELSRREAIQVSRDRLRSIPKELCRLIPKKHHRVLQTEGTRMVDAILRDFARLVERDADD